MVDRDICGENVQEASSIDEGEGVNITTGLIGGRRRMYVYLNFILQGKKLQCNLDNLRSISQSTEKNNTKIELNKLFHLFWNFAFGLDVGYV